MCVFYCEYLVFFNFRNGVFWEKLMVWRRDVWSAGRWMMCVIMIMMMISAVLMASHSFRSSVSASTCFEFSSEASDCDDSCVFMVSAQLIWVIKHRLPITLSKYHPDVLKMTHASDLWPTQCLFNPNVIRIHHFNTTIISYLCFN